MLKCTIAVRRHLGLHGEVRVLMSINGFMQTVIS